MGRKGGGKREKAREKRRKKAVSTGVNFNQMRWKPTKFLRELYQCKECREVARDPSSLPTE